MKQILYRKDLVAVFMAPSLKVSQSSQIYPGIPNHLLHNPRLTIPE